VDTPDLSIVIVSFNTRELLRRCLASLPAGAAPRTTEVIVVDNASRDGSVEMVRAEFPDVQLIASDENLGFARGTNLGLAAARGRFRMWLNSDCETPAGGLALLLDHLERHPEAGCAGPRLEYADGRVQPSAQAFPQPSILFLRLLNVRALARPRFLRAFWRGASPLFGRMAAGYVRALDPGAGARPVDWISGACLVAPADVAEAVGPLDEGYFMYCEDTDWCRRVHALGREVHFVPEAVVLHHVGASRKANPVVTFHYYRSLVRYFERYHPRHHRAFRAALVVAFGMAGAVTETARLFGRRGEHPWWRLARYCREGEGSAA